MTWTDVTSECADLDGALYRRDGSTYEGYRLRKIQVDQSCQAAGLRDVLVVERKELS